MEKKKVLILYNVLFHYRIPIFNILSEKYDLTVAYSKESSKEDLDRCNFKTMYLRTKQFGRFIIHEDNLYKLCEKYDAVIAYGDISWLSLSRLALKKNRKFKIGYWGIGVSSSYNRKYDDGNKFIDFVRNFFHKNADALVFYSDYPIPKYVKAGYKREQLFVANNTVEVEKFDENETIEKDSILFIGTLYLEKGLQYLLESYKEALAQNSNLPDLNIVGGGSQFEQVKGWVAENNLKNKVHLHGAIFDKKIKSKIFKKSLACISPNQAGLSVLESMGYGVPFITYEDAITGGEAFNIINDVSGYRLKKSNSLKEIILDIAKNTDKYIAMGKESHKQYWEQRKPIDMANGLIDMVEYMTGKRQ